MHNWCLCVCVSACAVCVGFVCADLFLLCDFACEILVCECVPFWKLTCLENVVRLMPKLGEIKIIMDPLILRTFEAHAAEIILQPALPEEQTGKSKSFCAYRLPTTVYALRPSIIHPSVIKENLLSDGFLNFNIKSPPLRLFFLFCFLNSKPIKIHL